MDVVAHALWTTVAATVARRKSGRPIRLVWAAFWGVLPDLVSFSIPAVLRIWWWLTGASKSLLPQANGPHFEWVWGVYNCSHSAVTFAAVFGVVRLFARRLPVEMFGWLFHIVIDIFTHRGWFAIQFLWPLSTVHVNGIPWEMRWLLAVNYALLVLATVVVWMLPSAHFSQRRGKTHFWPRMDTDGHG